MSREQIVCSTCGKQKDELHAQPSKLMAGQTLICCNDCIAKKFEPRWLIILVGKQGGFTDIKSYIEKHRYHGEPITAKEIMPSRGS